MKPRVESTCRTRNVILVFAPTFTWARSQSVKSNMLLPPPSKCTSPYTAGGSTDAEPSSQELADLVAVVREDKVAAIFSNNTVNPRLVEAVADEAGTELKVVQLFEGSVGPEGSGAETYATMMLTNAQRIADALK